TRRYFRRACVGAQNPTACKVAPTVGREQGKLGTADLKPRSSRAVNLGSCHARDHICRSKRTIVSERCRGHDRVFGAVRTLVAPSDCGATCTVTAGNDGGADSLRGDEIEQLPTTQKGDGIIMSRYISGLAVFFVAASCSHAAWPQS